MYDNFERDRHSCKDNMKLHHREIVYENVKWIEPTKDND